MSALDLDFYKLTMLQFIWKHYADVPVTFSLHSRKQDLTDVISLFYLYEATDSFLYEELSDEEQKWLLDKGFNPSFVNDLAGLFRSGLAVPEIRKDSVTVSGSWFATTLWETVILSDVSEWYSEQNVERPSMFKTVGDIYTIARTGAKWADFGTRRRYSRDYHRKLIADLAAAGEGSGFIGTSNVEFAIENDIPAIGTYAHELEMVLRPYFDTEFDTTRDVLTKWQEMYPRNQRIALTDTYTTPKFLEDHGKFLLENDWRGVRLDSADPVKMGKMVDEWLSRTRSAHLPLFDVVFSDGLKAEAIMRLQNTFAQDNGHPATFINPLFGWGTGLTNPNSDLSLVMKATHSNGQKTYKITDDEGKTIR